MCCVHQGNFELGPNLNHNLNVLKDQIVCMRASEVLHHSEACTAGTSATRERISIL